MASGLYTVKCYPLNNDCGVSNILHNYLTQ